MRIKRTFIFKNNISLGSQKRLFLIISILFVLYIPSAKSQDNKSDYIALIKYCAGLKRRLVHVENINNARWVLSNNDRYVGHFNLNGRIKTSNLVLSHDTLFVSKRDTIICFNGKTGEKYWTKKYKFNKKIINTRSNIIITYYKSLKGIDKKTGELVWTNDKYHVNASKYNEQKNLVFLTKDSTIVGLDASTGEKRWEYIRRMPFNLLMTTNNFLIGKTILR